MYNHIAKIIAEKSIIETNNIIVNQWDEIIETFNKDLINIIRLKDTL